ncbi:MAG: hypothetical protein D6805_02650, partial [Planctomycetota bacterium]
FVVEVRAQRSFFLSFWRGDWRGYLLNMFSRFEGVCSREELRVFRKRWLERVSPVVEGCREEVLGLLGPVGRFYVLWTERGICFRGKFLFYPQIGNFWRQGGGKVVFQLVGRRGGRRVVWRLPSRVGDVLERVLEELLPASRREFGWEDLPDARFDWREVEGEKRVIGRQMLLSCLVLYGVVLGLGLGFAVEFCWQKWVGVGLFFGVIPLYRWWKCFPVGVRLEDGGRFGLRRDRVEWIKAEVKKVVEELDFARSPQVFVFLSWVPGLMATWFPFRLYVGLPVFWFLGGDEFRALCGKALFHREYLVGCWLGLRVLELGLVLGLICLPYAWWWWVVLGLVWVGWENLSGYLNRRLRWVQSILAARKASVLWGKLPLINGWLKLGTMGEILARGRHLVDYIFPRISPFFSSRQRLEFFRRVFSSFPLEGTSLARGNELLYRASLEVLTLERDLRQVEFFLSSWCLDWCDFDYDLPRGELDAQEYNALLERLSQKDICLFPFVEYGVGEPTLEELLLGLEWREGENG